MDAKGMNALLVSQRENIRYLTGFTGSAGLAIVTANRLLLVTDFRYQLQARKEAPGASLVIQKKDWATTLLHAAKQRGKKLSGSTNHRSLDRVKLLRSTAQAHGAKTPSRRSDRSRTTPRSARSVSPSAGRRNPFSS
jgi:Xaa-Pro aminopeptidase